MKTLEDVCPHPEKHTDAAQCQNQIIKDLRVERDIAKDAEATIELLIKQFFAVHRFREDY